MGNQGDAWHANILSKSLTCGGAIGAGEQGAEMVIGKERTNWYGDHPPACNCAACGKRRVDNLRFEAATGGRKVGRNEPCPCGSGVKFKRCHGA